MGQRIKWWIGLLPLLALWLGVNTFAMAPVEGDLAGRANAAVEQITGEPGLSVVAGRDVSVNGQIFDESTRAAALVAVAALPGVRKVTDRLSPPPPANPWLWRAVLEGGVLTISGATPSPRERTAVVAAAQKALPQTRVVDQSSFFSGAPADFVIKAEGALQVLAHLSAGEAQLRGDKLSVSGETATPADYQAAVALAHRAAAVIMDVAAPKASSGVKAPPGVVKPYMLGAEKSEKALTLSGFYPDDAAHEKILAVAAEKFAGLALTDKLLQGAGAPNGFLAASLTGLEQLARLRAGQFVLLDGAVSLDGEAVRAEVADEVKTAFVAAVPGGFAVQTQLTGAAREAPPALAAREAPPAPKTVAIDPHVDANTCRDQLRVLLLATPIKFEYARAEISRDSSAALESAAAIVRRCPAVAFEVAGHWRNAHLALGRAENVVAWLVGAGIDRARLTATAAGESGPGDPPEVLETNRHIEFKLGKGAQ